MAEEPRSGQSLARSQLNKVELATFEAVLRAVAPIIDALLVEGIPYTKVILPTPQQEVPNAANYPT